ncbi:MAG: SDR family oxidoreductase [Actinobacteria bacterium]|nr:SDR family oxidoreductase [Actinomycetota bacterium]
MRVVVVGASSGLGRCIGVGLAKEGARVALLSRRAERIGEAAREAGNNAVAIICDATDAASCASAIDQAADALGGIDGVVYAPGVGPLSRIEDLSVDQWRAAFDTNVVGASLMTAAALPHLVAAHGAAIYLSSVSASVTPPWPGLGAYAVTKAALDKLVEAWRAEHPSVGFTRIVVGDCAGGEGDSMTEFANNWDSVLASEFAPIWFSRGYMSGALMSVERLVDVVSMVLRGGATDSMPSVTVTPRSPSGVDHPS